MIGGSAGRETDSQRCGVGGCAGQAVGKNGFDGGQNQNGVDVDTGIGMGESQRGCSGPSREIVGPDEGEKDDRCGGHDGTEGTAAKAFRFIWPERL